MRAADVAITKAAFGTEFGKAQGLVSEADRLRATDLAMSWPVQSPGAVVRAELATTVESITSDARRIARDHPSLKLTAYVAFSRAQAVLVHADAVPAAWAVAVAIDLLPLLLLAVLVVARRCEEPAAMVMPLRPAGT